MALYTPRAVLSTGRVLLTLSWHSRGCSAAWVPLRPLYVLKQEFEPMSPKCRHVNATSTQRLPACLQEALRALLDRRLRRLWRFFFNIADRMDYFQPKFPPPNRRVARDGRSEWTLQRLTDRCRPRPEGSCEGEGDGILGTMDDTLSPQS